MSSYRNKPDRLEGVAQTRLLDALGSCRQAVISAQTQVKVAGPVYHGCQMVTAAIDALAKLITGSSRYFRSVCRASEVGAGQPGGRVRDATTPLSLRFRSGQCEIKARAICHSCNKTRGLGPPQLPDAAWRGIPLDGSERQAQSVRLPITLRAALKALDGEKRAMKPAVLRRHSHRDLNGEISHKHGSVHVGTLRKIYGQAFAAGHGPDATLYELLELNGPYTLSEMHLKMLQQDYEDGSLPRKLAKVFGRR
jgi:hypothetical protein